ncbi:DinB family protein [Bacillus sp. FJAT-49736]|uniref:DinB family protein n=1 Tax=Bacillus sp. FJAT-49736 TaxID=2833582 RepID=UPI001BC9E7E8|nr:DinB family protein [Bacillus sp. FJAT-49736]MBS4174609.1 DinB family protein [Bacillus sp. FJAT-49736]
MSTTKMKEVLFSEWDVAVRTISNLLTKVQEKDWDYRPQKNMRTLLELANHLVQIPTVDLAIGQEKKEQEIRDLENKLQSGNANGLTEVLKNGYKDFKVYYDSLSENDFFDKVSKPFYFGENMQGHSQAKWLAESTTHIFHHRAQFFNYLKELGYEVNMFDLY